MIQNCQIKEDIFVFKWLVKNLSDLMMCVFKFFMILLWFDRFPLGLNCQLKFNYDELEFLLFNDNSKYEID